MQDVSQYIDCVVDINPVKQGNFIPIVGLPVLSPQNALQRNIKVIIVANYIYIDEVKKYCKDISFSPYILSLE